MSDYVRGSILRFLEVLGGKTRQLRVCGTFGFCCLAVCPDPNVRNGAKAVEYAKRACELSEWKIPVYFDTLASAYAEAGDFGNAVRWENKSLASNASYATLERMGLRLSLYEQKMPYHEEKP